MTKKVVSYFNVVPAKNKSQEKIDILKKFINGVNVAGDKGILYTGNQIQDCDVGMIQGWQHELGKNSPHLRLRESVINNQLIKNKHVCTADANLFLYANPDNHPWHYLRYSFNGVFPTTGIYCDTDPDPKRWHQISRDLDIKLEKQKRQGNHILICVQRNGGWSMGQVPLDQWCVNTVHEIRKHTDRPIVIRLHPGDKRSQKYTPQKIIDLIRIPGVTISQFGRDIRKDLKNCWAVVNHNSSAIVGPLIQGYPAFITDPDKSQCKEVTHHTFENIENPQEFDRLAWLERISMFHWKFNELDNGDCWRHMRRFL